MEEYQVSMSFIKENFQTAYNKDFPRIYMCCFKCSMHGQVRKKVRPVVLFEVQVFSMGKTKGKPLLR